MSVCLPPNQPKFTCFKHQLIGFPLEFRAVTGMFFLLTLFFLLETFNTTFRPSFP